MAKGHRTLGDATFQLVFHTFSFLLPSFLPSFPTIHRIHKHCSSQKSHSLGVRSGLGIKKWGCLLFSLLARIY